MRGVFNHLGRTRILLIEGSAAPPRLGFEATALLSTLFRLRHA